MRAAPPRSEAELLKRARALTGLSLTELAAHHGQRPPCDLRRHKGWIGDLVERTLGTTAASRPLPDFVELGIELKTIPLSVQGQPRESTHVCTVALHDLMGQTWPTSTVRHKLARVLWLPVEARPGLALGARRIGEPVLWSPSAAQEQLLRADWEEHMELLCTGRMDELDARLGVVLQVRPKAANARSLVSASDRGGAPAATLPRGFYLRPAFTRDLLGALRSA